MIDKYCRSSRSQAGIFLGTVVLGWNAALVINSIFSIFVYCSWLGY